MKMFVTERRKLIVNLLKENKRVTVKDLATQLRVSEATLRSDLNQLEMEGLLKRTHGGGVLNEEFKNISTNENNFYIREKKNKNEKIKIAEEAIKTIDSKQCILLDGSSTVLELAKILKTLPIQLTVLTSGLQTALELKDNPQITVILIGGVVTKGSNTIEGTMGLSILRHINIDTMYTSANGFTITSGLTDFNLYEVALKQEMIKRANKVIGLIDSTKIGVTSSAVFATIDDIDCIITDKQIETEVTTEIMKNGVNLITAN